MSEQESTRNEYVESLRLQLFGPVGGEAEWLPSIELPHKRYITGVLYPRVRDENNARPSELEEEVGSVVPDADEPDDSPLAAMLQRAPASAGLTFAVSVDAEIDVQVTAGIYHPNSPMPSAEMSGDSPPVGYLRETAGPSKIQLSDEDQGDSSHMILNGRAELRVRWRPISGLRVVTISIVNVAEMSADDRIAPEDCLYQVQLMVECLRGLFREPPAPDVAYDQEEKSLRLRYRNKCAWATGHSTSVTWKARPDGTPPARIEIDFLPCSDIHPFSAGIHDGAEYDESALFIEELASTDNGPRLRSLLQPFVEDHGTWVEQQRQVDVAELHRPAMDQVIFDLEEQVKRLKRGIDILCDESDPHRLQAFRIANEAMLDQMERSAIRSGRTFDRSEARWRPFQLAFQMLAIPGVLPEGDGDGRDLVDLIWFPTGGGKTEAYLLLAAFTIVYRRLRFGVGGEGTCVISRYTLRLLTSQQFERTAMLVCSLELLRRTGVIPGDDTIDIGLWIGGGQHSSPNTCRDAFANYEDMLEEDRPINRFMLIECPWCGHSIVPARRDEDRDNYGVNCTPTDFSFRCPDSDCAFHDRLPVQVVDEAMYGSPPTILLATIDKFARLPWESRSRAYFGLDRGVRPPDLVIQDELHLISGPLGTIAAIYEAAIDVLICQGGDAPKYIAATATIRGARDQARHLYGREVRLFPASGPDADDSYYMTIDRKDTNSRRYVGIMGQGHSPVTNTVHVMATMVDAGQAVTNEDDYWTLVAYHNSRRELGKTMTLARDDVPSRIQLICDKNRQNIRRKCEEVVELSGNLKSYQVPQVLSSLKFTRESDAAVDVLACTNMISVGVDVERLNAMMILGQPKMSSEYIQASSRVGRGRRVGGIVVANFSPTKPRDRSHYENFVRFHDSMYRWVEPTSVTPHSPPALDRALHAALIAALRLVLLVDDSAAKQFDPNSSGQGALCQQLRERLYQAIDSGERANFDSHFNEIVDWWDDATSQHQTLHYKSQRQFAGIMRFHEESPKAPARPTLNSMRNVDGDATAFILGGS